MAWLACGRASGDCVGCDAWSCPVRRTWRAHAVVVDALTEPMLVMLDPCALVVRHAQGTPRGDAGQPHESGRTGREKRAVLDSIQLPTDV